VSWTEAQAERRLRSLELFGMRFGLDRMRRMMTALHSPGRSEIGQQFDSIQVLGTNGKSSTTRMAAAILSAHGLRTGAYTSPHLVSYRERVLVDGRELAPDAFADAVARASHAAEQVNRTLGEDDHVTQFELLTAAALHAMAEREIEVAVIEAGLGGRYDATSVIDAPIVVLTNVGLEHTRWLGPTVRDIAEEKLAVVRPGGTVVLGRWLAEDAPDALDVARRIASERGARIVTVAEEPTTTTLAARGSFQRRNFALARAAAAEYLRDPVRGRRLALDEGAVLSAAAGTLVPGRLQVVSERPLTVLDGAHNPAAVDALTASLPELVGDRAMALVLGVLEDKDAAGMLGGTGAGGGLLSRCEQAWFTAPPSSRALSPAALQSLARQLSFEAVESEPRPERALGAASAWAGERPEQRAVLATGSIYLVGELLRQLEPAHLAHPSQSSGKLNAVEA
jgi:dihydrofolate synthase / folylpolyglutamate synthase